MSFKIAVFLGIILLIGAYYKRHQKQENPPEFPKLNKEMLLNSIRKFSFENQSNQEAYLTLSLYIEGEQDFEDVFVMPANESGWIPFFTPGILHVRYKDQVLKIDLTDKSKEYTVILNPSGKISHIANDIKKQ